MRYLGFKIFNMTISLFIYEFLSTLPIFLSVQLNSHGSVRSSCISESTDHLMFPHRDVCCSFICLGHFLHSPLIFGIVLKIGFYQEIGYLY